MTSRPLWLPTFAASWASCRIPASTSSLFSIPRSYAALILVQASLSPPLHLESCHRNFVSAFAKEMGPGPELVSFPSIATQCAGGRYGTGDPNLLLKLSPRLPLLAPFNNNKIHWTSMCRIGVIKQPCACCHARPALKRIQVQIAGNGETPIVLSCLQKTQALILSSYYIHELTTETWIFRSELRWRASLLSSSNKSSSRRMPAWIHDARSGARRASEHNSRETKQITWRETGELQGKNSSKSR